MDMISRFEHSEKANYLVLCTEQKEEKMADRMLLQNEIKGLLSVRIERINGYKEYYYDISSKHSLGSIVKKGSLDVPKIRLLIKTIGEILKQFHEYMLEPDGICLSEELIYTTLPEWNLQFCYFEEEGKKFSEKIRKLLQFIIEYVNYQDKEAVTLAYACYQAAMQENFTFAKIENCLFKTERQEIEADKKIEIKKEVLEVAETGKKEEFLTEINKQHNLGIRLAAELQIQNEVMEEEAEESSFDAEKAKRISCYIVGGGFLLTGGLWLVAEEGIFYGFDILKNIPSICFPAFGAGVSAVVFIVWAVIKKRWKEKTKLVTKEIQYSFDQNRQKDKIENNHQYKEQNQSKKQDLSRKQDLYKEQNSDLYIEQSFCQMQDVQEKEYGKTVLLSYRAEEEHRILFSCQEEYPSIEIMEYPCSIGKMPSFNQAVIVHEGISRIHCSIQKEADGYTITDRNSTNGVVVNGRRLTPNETAELPLESEIILGILHYIFR